MLGFSYATLRESKSLLLCGKMIQKKVYEVNLNLIMCRSMEARVSSLIPVLLWMEMIDTGDLQVPLRTPRSINFRWIAVSWPRPLLKLHLINFPHIWCRNIEWCMRSFIDSSCWEWKWSIHRRDVISKCLCGTPRSMLFRWIAICSSSENFTWFTSPSHICAGI